MGTPATLGEREFTPTSTPFLVLCVDDEPSGLQLRQLILEREGYSVCTARSESEALAIFKSRDFDIVVTDHLLGRETGTATAKEMKRLKPYVPIIVLSGAADRPEGIEIVDAFLCKAEGPQSLLTKVRELAVRSRTTRASNVAYMPKEEMLFSTHSETLQLLAAIVESSEDAIISKTLDGTIMTWNKSAEKMYGYRAEEVIGQPVSLIQPSDRGGEVHDMVERLKKGQKVEHLETMRVAKDGHLLTVLLTLSPIWDAGGQIVGASTIARDITRSKLAEQSLRNSEKLAVAGRMAATVAHEINNPLEAVTNALYLLAESSSLDASARQFLTVAQDELAKIRQIATATLGLHRGDAEHQQPVSVPKLIDNVLSLYRRRLNSLGIAVDTRYETDVLVNAFPGELRQVFSNLIVNAVDAMDKSGNKLCIHIFASSCGTNPTQKGIRITISDNGAGIPADKRGQLFELFYTTKGNKGTGIGLWVCLGIVQKYGGKIRLRSTVKPGHSGTTFSVFLPTAAAPVEIDSIAS
jgi:PAS domain S-box-containing protein